MQGGEQAAENGTAATAATAAGIEPELFGAMLGYVRESVIVVDEDWTMRANLSAPDGLLGWGDPTGLHLLAYVHPDDVLRFADTGTGLRLTDPGWSGSARVRLQRSDGTYGHYEFTMHNRTDDPVVRGMVVCTREVDRPVVEVAPELERTGLVPALADQLPVGVVLVSGTGRPLYVNEVACELLGTTREAFVTSGLHRLIDEADRLQVGAIVRELTRRAGRRTLIVHAGATGQRRLEATFVSQTSAALAAGSEKEVLLVVVTIEDVTNRLEREEELEHRANRDALTGLRNRAWLLDHLHDRLTSGAELTVAYVDLVGFKSVNDRLGHRSGDLVLTAVAQGVAMGLDSDAEAARVGGDEFVVVVEGLADHQHERLCARVRAAVETVPQAVELGVTASVGVVSSEPGDQPWDLLARADTAMYADKRSARRPKGPDPTSELAEPA